MCGNRDFLGAGAMVAGFERTGSASGILIVRGNDAGPGCVGLYMIRGRRGSEGK